LPTETPTLSPTDEPTTATPSDLPTAVPTNAPTGCLVRGAKMHVLFKENVAGRRLLAKMGVFYAQTNILQLVTACSDRPYPVFRLSLFRLSVPLIPIVGAAYSEYPYSDCPYPLFRLSVLLIPVIRISYSDCPYP
jgi:hypothetical protein